MYLKYKLLNVFMYKQNFQETDNYKRRILLEFCLLSLFSVGLLVISFFDNGASDTISLSKWIAGGILLYIGLAFLFCHMETLKQSPPRN